MPDREISEQLLGYLLGALELGEHARVERQLQYDASLRRELESLRAALGPLAAGRRDFDPPPGLASRTCRLVDSMSTDPAQPVCPPSSRATPAASTPPASSAARPAPIELPRNAGSAYWGLTDVGMAAGLLFVAALLLFPAISNSRSQSLVEACGYRLRGVFTAMVDYNEWHGGNLQCELGGRPSNPASLLAVLRDAGLLQDARLAICPGPGARRTDLFALESLPTAANLEALPKCELEPILVKLRAIYGFSLARPRGQSSRSDEEWRRAHLVTIADAPDRNLHLASSNHDGLGQNVMFQDGSVRLLKTAILPLTEDNIYNNMRGMVGPPLSVFDVVVLSSRDYPLPESSGR